jgi:hypothetical protein
MTRNLFLLALASEGFFLLVTPPKSDPFDSITGLVDSEETDLASQVDQILYR